MISNTQATTVRSFSSADLPASRRIDYWADVVSQLAGDVQVDPLGADTLDGNVEVENLSRLRLSRIEFSRFRAKLPATSNHARAHVEIMFMTHGHVHLEQDNRQVLVGPEECLAWDDSRPFILMSEASSRFVLVDIPSDIVRRSGLPLKLLTARRPSDSNAARVAFELLEAIHREYNAVSPQALEVMAKSLLDLLLLPFSSKIETSAVLKNSDVLRLRAKSYINAHLGDPDLNIETLARALGYSKRYIHVLFNGEGTTIDRYIWRSRLERCKQELEGAVTARKSVSAIAFDWGFSSSSHFTRLFKKQFGFLPSAVKARRDHTR